MNELHDWAEKEQYKMLPKSPIGKAIGYFLNQWKKLHRVLEAGELELDNNQIENKIRPLALGRKNYLFAGNHNAGQNIAMMYSFFATCKEHNVNPYDWLKDVLEKISDTKMTDLEKLLPQNWSPDSV
jgi:transposase